MMVMGFDVGSEEVFCSRLSYLLGVDFMHCMYVGAYFYNFRNSKIFKILCIFFFKKSSLFLNLRNLKNFVIYNTIEEKYLEERIWHGYFFEFDFGFRAW